MEITAQAILDVLLSGWPRNPTLGEIEKLDPIWYDYLRNHRYFWTENDILTKREKEIKEDVISVVYVAGNWRSCLMHASRVGDSDIFNYVESKYLKSKGGYTDISDINWFMSSGAAEGGHLKYVKYFASKGGDNWDSCMVYASMRGHYDVVEYCGKQGGTRWDGSAQFAAQYGCINIMHMATYQKEIIDWDMCMWMGATRDHILTVKYAESQGANNFNECMKTAAKQGNDISFIEHLESKGADNFNECMSQAACAGNLEFIKHFQLKGANNFHECIISSSMDGYFDIIKYFEKQIRLRYHSIFPELPICLTDIIMGFSDNIDWNEIMVFSQFSSTETKWLEIIKYSEDKGADNWDQCLYNANDRNVYNSHNSSYGRIIEYCKSKGGDESKAKDRIVEPDENEWMYEQYCAKREEGLKHCKSVMIECGLY